MTRLLTALTALAACGVLAAGCGSNDNGGGSTGSSGGGGGGYGGGAPAKTTTKSGATSSNTGGGTASTITMAAVESNGLSFSKKAVTTKAGKVTITMDNPSGNSQPHAVAIEGNGVDQDGDIAQPGAKSTVSLDLKAGTYTFYCPVDGHRQAGMEGTLKVS